MKDDEKKLLSVHRLRNWLRAFEQAQGEIAATQSHLVELGHGAGYARLEALEEVERLKALGLSPEQITGTLVAMGLDARVVATVVTVGEPGA